MEKNIKKILETLENEGYQAYLVGGFVRDYYLAQLHMMLILPQMPYLKIFITSLIVVKVIMEV